MPEPRVAYIDGEKLYRDGRINISRDGTYGYDYVLIFIKIDKNYL